MMGDCGGGGVLIFFLYIGKIGWGGNSMGWFKKVSMVFGV